MSWKITTIEEFVEKLTSAIHEFAHLLSRNRQIGVINRAALIAVTNGLIPAFRIISKKEATEIMGEWQRLTTSSDFLGETRKLIMQRLEGRGIPAEVISKVQSRLIADDEVRMALIRTQRVNTAPTSITIPTTLGMLPLSELEADLPVRAERMRGTFPGMTTLKDLLEKQPAELLRIGHFGRRTLAAVEKRIAEIGAENGIELRLGVKVNLIPLNEEGIHGLA